MDLGNEREHSPTWVCTKVRGWCGDVYICRFASPFSFLFPFSSLFEMAPLLSLKLEASNRLTARVSRVLGAGAYRQRQAFVWVLGVQSRVLMLRQQVLYALSYLPTSKRAFKAWRLSITQWCSAWFAPSRHMTWQHCREEDSGKVSWKQTAEGLEL